LSGWYRHLAEHDLVGANPVAPVRRPRVDADHTATVGLDRDQARALIAAADADLGPMRLRSAAVRLLLHLGLRVDELARADVADLGYDRGHRTVTVTRKGGGRATLALPAPTGNALDTYLADRAGRAGVVVGELGGPLLATAHGRGRIRRSCGGW
jgi:integrase/recombinase XerD